MSLDLFVPAFWSEKLLLELKKNLVFGQESVINRDYEGEIQSAGDTVKIHSFGPVSVFDYTKNTPMGLPQVLDDAEKTLTIDQSKAFNFMVDDIDKAQQKPKVMSDAMSDAAYRLRDETDQFIAGHYLDAGGNIGTDALPITVSAAERIYDSLVDAGVLLDEANVPREGRFVIIPPWVYGMILKDPRFVGTGSAMADANLLNGQIGRAAGFTVSESNNVAKNTDRFYILAGHKMAWSFADQINEVEAYRPHEFFSDAVKGLHVYGMKTVRPEALVCLTLKKG